MNSIRTVDPVDIPVTLSEVKSYLRVSDVLEDADIAFMVRSTVAQLDGAEGWLNGRALMTQTWQTQMAGFHSCGFDLPITPVQSVSGVTYLDEAGDTQTLASSVYRVRNLGNPLRRARLELAADQSWPATSAESQSVTVTYVAGYGDRNDVPEHIRHLILVMVKEAYDHRQPLVLSTMVRSPAFNGLFELARYPVGT